MSPPIILIGEGGAVPGVLAPCHAGHQPRASWWLACLKNCKCFCVTNIRCSKRVGVKGIGEGNPVATATATQSSTRVLITTCPVDRPRGWCPRGRAHPVPCSSSWAQRGHLCGPGGWGGLGAGATSGSREGGGRPCGPVCWACGPGSFPGRRKLYFVFQPVTLKLSFSSSFFKLKKKILILSESGCSKPQTANPGLFPGQCWRRARVVDWEGRGRPVQPTTELPAGGGEGNGAQRLGREASGRGGPCCVHGSVPDSSVIRVRGWDVGLSLG